MRRLFAGIAACLVTITSAHAQGNPWPARAQTAAAYLDQQWGQTKDWQGVGGWQRFVIADILIELQARTGDKRWNALIDKAVRNRSGLALNDDDLWAVIASVHAWRLNGDPELLEWAGTTYRRIVTTYWDDRCGGGLWWDPRRTYKNAITNELLIYASTQLYLATGQDAYRDWALRGWAWFAQSGMIGQDGLVNDGLNAACQNNGQPRYSYNQGVLLGGLSDLTRITGDPAFRAAAVETALAATNGLSTPEGILREEVPIGDDGLMFKGIFALHMRHLLDDMPPSPERTRLSRWAGLNAEAIWRISDSGTRAIGSDWSQSGSVTGAAPQASGLAMLLAAEQ